MNAMTTFTLKSLRANKVRTLVTIAGVALAAALLTAVLTSYTSLLDMMCRGEQQSSGTWMAEVQTSDLATLEQEAATAQDQGTITGFAALQDVGFGQLSEAQQSVYGHYLPISNIIGNVEELCAVRPEEGRLPQAPGEIMLSSQWREIGDNLRIGDTLTLPVGERRAVLAPGKEGSMSAGSYPVSGPTQATEEGAAEKNYEEGTPLDSSIGYFEAEVDGGIFNEELVDTEERTFTVVGFYGDYSYTAITNVGLKAFTYGEPATNNAVTFGYVSASGAENSGQLKQQVADALPGSTVTLLHVGLLRYLGINTGGAIWDTLYGIIAILAVVIIVACVSLIYNAFAISVAERSGQFGLLASVGASRRQLRRAVVVEALTVALIGIPLGLLVGIAGCAVTFFFLGGDIATLFGANQVEFRLAVEPMVLALIAVLTLVTVLLSVFVPAWRASRTNVIDALRGRQSERASKKGQRQAANAARAGRLWKGQGLAGRVFGIGGTLARMNEKRGASKGTAASVSLALAIVLLMTAGSLSAFLGTLATVASGGGVPAGDVGVTASFDSDSERGLAGQTMGGGDSNGDGPAEPETLEELVAQRDQRFAEEAVVYGRAFEAMKTVPDAQPIGWHLDSRAAVTIDSSMISPALAAEGSTGMGSGGMSADGQYISDARFSYVDDAAFDSYAASLGQNPADYRDPAHPRAIAVKQAYGNNGSTYTMIDTIVATGTVRVTEGFMYDGRPVDGYGFDISASNEGESGYYSIVPYVFDEEDDSYHSLDDAAPGSLEEATVDLEVAAIADEAPGLVGMSGEGVSFILPMSMAAHYGFYCYEPTFRSLFNAPEGQSADVAQELVDKAGEFFHDQDQFELAFLYMNDFVGELSQAQMMATVVNVFCLLFTVILALIAMANVFNTVTNGLILRRREFAVMRSVGLSNRQFRRMIADECVTWCLRGLIPGIVLSLGISYLLYRQVALSMSGMGFFIPWGYVALAVALTAFAILSSVAYGMHRCKADNLVEALRTDNV